METNELLCIIEARKPGSASEGEWDSDLVGNESYTESEARVVTDLDD